MPKNRSKKYAKDRKKELALESTPRLDEDDSENSVVEKDEEEEELDRLVLGDGAGFKAQLGMEMDIDEEDESGSEGEALEEEEQSEGGIEEVDDADLFFMDGGPSTVDKSALIPLEAAQDEEGEDAVAWEDSDDDRLAISLASNPRLRKLRVKEAEDVISGREYTNRLRRQYERLNPVPEWAIQASSRPAKRRRRSSAGSFSSISSDDMDVDDSDLSTLPLARLLQSTNPLTQTAQGTKRAKLRPEVLDIQRTREIPMTQPSAVTSLSFHPTYPVLLSSGPASTLYLHHINPTAHPTPNPLLTSVHIRRTPLTTSAFLPPQGDKIYFSGRRRYFRTWDLPSGTITKTTRVYGQKDEQRSMERFKLSPCGRYMALVGTSKKGGGIINVLDAATTQWIASARIEGKNGVADFAWWSDGEGFTVVGKGGEVGEWSLESRTFIARWIDDGSIGATVVALGGHNGPAALGGDRWVVIGSQSGVTNIYNRRSFVTDAGEVKIPSRPEPTRRFMQLTTPTSNVAFSPDGQLLVISSQWKKDALRIIHLPSCTVYRNWPTSSTPLGRITAVAFSSGSDMLAVANEAGKIRLWEIRA
ncbi:U3 small nucleolar RNA-associated protein-like protein [Xylogone sp. PMI_703]|nr:U3 small nucleolar RNA-associated protein-like protein [Xylogone sp. PMI_703]